MRQKKSLNNIGFMEKTFSLDEEVGDGQIVTKELKAVWNVELDLLYRFLKFCADNNLKW